MISIWWLVPTIFVSMIVGAGIALAWVNYVWNRVFR